MLRKLFLTILMIIELSIPNIVSELIEKKFYAILTQIFTFSVRHCERANLPLINREPFVCPCLQPTTVLTPNYFVSLP